MLRERIFRFIAKLADSRAGWVFLGAALLLTIGSSFLIPRLPILTSREGLVSEKIPAQRRYIEYNNDFGTPNHLIILLEGDKEKLKPAGDAVAKALKGDPAWVKNVFYKIDLDSISKSGLYYLPEEDLRKIDSALLEHRDFLRAAFDKGSWEVLLEELLKKSSFVSLENTNETGRVDMAFEALFELLDSWLEYLENPEEATLALGDNAIGKLAADREEFVDKDGYLVGRGSRSLVMFVQQSHPEDNTDFILPFMAHCRNTVKESLENFPGVTAGFTGWPVSIEEEITLIEGDLAKVTLFSGIIILSLFLLAFRSIHRTILVFIPLVFGVIWNLALTYFTIGHLNYLTSVFIGVLFGLGIDYGVVFIRRFDEERGKGAVAKEAILTTLVSVGPGITTGAATTIAAFFAIGLTDQPAFSELGIVAGTGVLCVLLSTFLILPSLMAKFPPKNDPVKTERLAQSRLLRSLSAALLKRPKTVAIVGCLICVFMFTRIPKVGFDFNINNLLPKDSETLRVAQKLESITDYKLQYVLVVAQAIDEVRALVPKLESLSTVHRVESVALAIPKGQKEKREIIFPSINEKLDKIKIGTPPGKINLTSLQSRVSSALDKVETAQEDVFSSKTKNWKLLYNHLDDLREKLENIGDALLESDAAKNHSLFEADFFNKLTDAKTELTSMLNAPPVTIDTLPKSLTSRFVSKSGKFATYVFPNEKIWDVEFLDAFLSQIREVASTVLDKKSYDEKITGFGVVFQVTSRQILNGFIKSSWMAGVVVLLMLLVDFRKLRYVFCAAAPLFIATAVTMGGLGLMGRDLNLASQISFPILLGIGVDYGVLITKRFIEQKGRDLPNIAATIGSAITLAGATTIAGFGSLLFARHRGLAAFGEVLVVAVLVCLFSSLFFLPALIKSLKLDKFE